MSDMESNVQNEPPLIDNIIEFVMSHLYMCNPQLESAANTFISNVEEMSVRRDNASAINMKLSRFELFNQVYQTASCNTSSHLLDTLQTASFRIHMSQFADTLQILAQSISDRDTFLYLSTCTILTKLQYQIFHVIYMNMTQLSC